MRDNRTINDLLNEWGINDKQEQLDESVVAGLLIGGALGTLIGNGIAQGIAKKKGWPNIFDRISDWKAGHDFSEEEQKKMAKEVEEIIADLPNKEKGAIKGMYSQITNHMKDNKKPNKEYLGSLVKRTKSAIQGKKAEKESEQESPGSSELLKKTVMDFMKMDPQALGQAKGTLSKMAKKGSNKAKTLLNNIERAQKNKKKD